MRRGVVAILVMGLMMWAGGSAAQDRGIEVRLKASEAVGAPDAGAVRLYNNSYALVIGIDAYSGGWPRLSNAVADARAVAAALEGKGFEVTLKTDLDRVGLESALQEFFVVKGDDPAARLFVWFAGHGHSDGGEGYLVPRDAPRPQVGAQFKLKALSMLRIGEYVRQARSKHVFAVFDSCFAGTVFDGQRALPPAAITRSTTLPVRQFLTSGDADQTVSDDGTFRELFLRALNGEENADANGDGYLTAGELSMFLSDRVTNLTRTRQTPRWGKLRHKDFDRGDFVFALPAAARVSTPVPPAPDADAMTCRALQNSTNVAAFQGYLREFPKGQCAAFARVQVANLSPVAPPSQPPISTNRDPQAAYDEAYLLLVKGDYDGGEQALQAFINAYPGHQLAGNAQYWLGDIALSQRKDFARAAKLFDDAYKRNTKHAKAPDMLYKLAASLDQLGMKDQACRTYESLLSKHPDMADRIKRAVKMDEDRLGCKESGASEKIPHVARLTAAARDAFLKCGRKGSDLSVIVERIDRMSRSVELILARRARGPDGEACSVSWTKGQVIDLEQLNGKFSNFVSRISEHIVGDCAFRHFYDELENLERSMGAFESGMSSCGRG